MSNYYWNEYVRTFVDEKIVNKELKYYQSIVVRFPEKIDTNCSQFVDFDNVPFSDIAIDIININLLPTTIKKLFKALKEEYKKQNFIITMPVLVCLTDQYELSRGCYTFNFKKECIIKYKENCDLCIEVLQNMSEGNAEFVVSFFANLQEAVCMFKQRALLESALQIGKVMQSLLKKNSNKKDANEITLPQQIWGNAIGVNMRKELLITNVILKNCK